MLSEKNQSRTASSKMAEVAQSPRSDQFGIAPACLSKIHRDELTHHQRCWSNGCLRLAVWRAVCRSAYRNSMPSNVSSAKNSWLFLTLDQVAPTTLPSVR